MRHVMDKTLHNAYDALEAANRKLDKGRMSAKQARTLMDIADRAHATIDRQMRMDADRMENAMPYKDTNIGYGAKDRGRTADDTRSLARAVMDLADRILPQVDDDEWDDDVEDRRGRGWRPRRTRRGVGRFTQVRRHVRRMPGRADMNEHYNDDEYTGNDYRGNNDADYGNADYSDIDHAVNNANRTAADAKRAADDARRTADEARRAADEARRAANNANPVMRNDNARYDNARSDRRYTSDDTADNRMRGTGPV